MATYSALPATLNLVATVSNDFTLSLTVTENGSPWVATGATLATDIIDSSGAVVATDFTTAASTGSVTLSLTDTQTGTLGVGVYSYRLSVTKSSLTRDWIAGTLSIVEAGVGGRSTSDVSLAITDTTISLTLNSMVASNAANIIVADAGGFYTGDDVEEVLAEIMATPSTTTRRVVELATNAEALARTDTERAVTPANLSQFTILSRTNGVAAAPTNVIAQSIPRWAVNSAVLPQTSGQHRLSLIWLPAGTINSITFVSGTTAAVSPTNQWFTLYDTSRNRLAVTNDDTTTAWAASTAKTLTISGGYTVATEGYYYIGCVVVASTVPTIAGAATTSLPTQSIAPMTTGFGSSGLTNPASAPAVEGVFGNLSNIFYCYVS